MSILVDENTRLLVQGITGREGSFHAERCMAYGTNVVAGVTPGKGGETVLEKIPVFDSVREAVAETAANVALIFVPAPFAADAVWSPPTRACRSSCASRRASRSATRRW